MKNVFKKVFITICALVVCMGLFAACGGDEGDKDQTPVSHKITTYTEGPFEDYYNIYANYSLAMKDTEVTVTLDNVWDFLTVVKVFANDTECTQASADGKFKFKMPDEVVVLRAEFDVVSIPERTDGMKWVNPEPVQAGSLLFTALEVDFGSEQIINSSYQTDDGYSSMVYAEVISTEQSVIPDSALTRITAKVNPSNGAYATGASVCIDATLVTAGKTTLIFIDTDNDRAITLEVTVLAANN